MITFEVCDYSKDLSVLNSEEEYLGDISKNLQGCPFFNTDGEAVTLEQLREIIAYMEKM